MSNTIYSDKIKVNCPLVHDEYGYYHLIYKVTNIVNGKIYVGKHSTKDPYDGYLGSGKAIKLAIEKYKPKNFTKEILYCFINEKEAYLKEEELVTQEFVERYDTYNITTGGKGFSSEDVRGEKNTNFGKRFKLTQETKDKISKAKRGKNVTKKQKTKCQKIMLISPVKIIQIMENLVHKKRKTKFQKQIEEDTIHKKRKIKCQKQNLVQIVQKQNVF